MLPESNLVIHNVGLNPTRSAVLDVLGSMGAPVSLVSIRSEHGELVGDVSVRHEPLKGGSIEGDAIAQLIDELPAIAVLGPYTEQGIEIRNAAELRVKESDRIAVLAENLRRMGAQVEELPDGLRVAGRSAGRLHGAEIEPHGDHRMAMAFAVAALGAEGETVIRDAECAAVSYPEFFSTCAASAWSSDKLLRKIDVHDARNRNLYETFVTIAFIWSLKTSALFKNARSTSFLDTPLPQRLTSRANAWQTS